MSNENKNLESDEAIAKSDLSSELAQQKSGATVVFYNDDKTKNVTFNFTEECGEWNIQVKFEPELKMKEQNNELYQNLASQFLDIIKS